MYPLTDADVERFWAKVDRSGEHWEWGGCRNGSGYGLFYIAGRQRALAHRVAFQLAHRPLAGPEETVDHLCYVRACVRPEHLDACSLAENSRRAHAHRARLCIAPRLEAIESMAQELRKAGRAFPRRPPAPTSCPLLVTQAQASSMLSLSLSMLRRFEGRGDLTAIRTDGAVYYRTADVYAFAKNFGTLGGAA